MKQVGEEARFLGTSIVHEYHGIFDWHEAVVGALCWTISFPLFCLPVVEKSLYNSICNGVAYIYQ